MKEMNEKEGITCLLVTHNENLANKFATNMVRLRDGAIEQYGEDY